MFIYLYVIYIFSCICLCRQLLFSSDVFIRAVKVSTGEDIDPHIINVVFQLFDMDGKNCTIKLKM